MGIDLVYGTYLTKTSEAISKLELRLMPLDLVAHWHRCSMTADYLAGFMAYHFEDHHTAHSILSTILNELLENTVKFSVDKTMPVGIVMGLSGDSIIFETMNVAEKKQAEKFAVFVRRLIDGDANELFVEQLEHTARSDSSSSGVGLITLKKDYGAGIGVRIQPSTHRGLYDVSVQVVLDTKEVEHP